MAGVTPEGFVAPTQQEVLALIEDDQLAEISAQLDISSDSALGQVNGIISQRLAQLWEVLQVAYAAFDLDAAELDQLTTLGKLTGTVRRGASYTFVTLFVNLDSGTTLLSGTHFAHVAGKPDVRFTPAANFTAPSTGFFEVLFRSEETGPVAANNSTITVIGTPVVGWNSVTNPSPATPGRDADNDATLRRRIEEKLAQSGGSTLAAIVADVLQVDAVEAAAGFENVTDGILGGMPPHSFEILVFDGDPGVADNDAIAQAIWDTKPAGIRPFGGDVGTARDALDAAHPVHFSRVAVAQIYINYTLVTTTGFVGNDAVRNYVVSECNRRFGSAPGVDVLALFCKALPLDLEGVIDVSEFAIGAGPGPTDETNVQIESRSIARFSTDHITISP